MKKQKTKVVRVTKSKPNLPKLNIIPANDGIDANMINNDDDDELENNDNKRMLRPSPSLSPSPSPTPMDDIDPEFDPDNVVIPGGSVTDNDDDDDA